MREEKEITAMKEKEVGEIIVMNEEGGIKAMKKRKEI
jgi:hypothetical protein